MWVLVMWVPGVVKVHPTKELALQFTQGGRHQLLLLALLCETQMPKVVM